MEGSCECAVRDESAGGCKRGSLEVGPCIFHEVLAAEGQTHLLRHLCCQHNATWLDAYSGHGVTAELSQCKTRGDSLCRIDISAGTGGGKT
jgi:hypothetical protein